MNIEDVKQLDSAILNIMVTSAMRGEIIDATIADIRRVNNYIACNYCYNIELAREAQARAMKVNRIGYVKTLCNVIHENLLDNCGEYGTLELTAVALLLNATPRQIVEAAYITLMEV